MNIPDAEVLFGKLAALMAPQITQQTILVGIHSGGVWLAERLHEALGVRAPLGTLDVAFYRDDYSSRGLHTRPRKSDIPVDIAGCHVILVDDVFYTGRTTRAALNELFDYGRPARVDLAVLVDRGERQLPVAPSFCPHTLAQALPAGSSLRLSRSNAGVLSFQQVNHA